MLKKSLFAGLMGVMLVSGMTSAKAEEENSRAAVIKALFDLGEGCKSVLDPNTKEIKGIFVIGSAPISKSLSSGEALKKARRDAMVDAQKAFSKYLNSSVKTAFDEKTKEVKLIEGASAGDEQGVSTEKIAKLTENKELFKSVSQSVQSGMEKEGEKREAGMLTAVYSWEPFKCAALKQAAKTMGDTASESVKQANRIDKVRSEKIAAKDTSSSRDSQPSQNSSGSGTVQNPKNVGAGPNAPVSDKTSVAPNISNAF